MANKFRYKDFVCVLDYLQGKKDVFVSGIDGRSADPLSYMTVVQPRSLIQAIESSNIPKSRWLDAAKFVETSSSGVGFPIIEITALLIKKHFCA